MSEIETIVRTDLAPTCGRAHFFHPATNLKGRRRKGLLPIIPCEGILTFDENSGENIERRAGLLTMCGSTG